MAFKRSGVRFSYAPQKSLSEYSEGDFSLIVSQIVSHFIAKKGIYTCLYLYTYKPFCFRLDPEIGMLVEYAPTEDHTEERRPGSATRPTWSTRPDSRALPTNPLLRKTTLMMACSSNHILGGGSDSEAPLLWESCCNRVPYTIFTRERM